MKVRGEGDGEGVVKWSESSEPCSSSSPADRNGSNFVRFTVSSALQADKYILIVM